MAVLLAPYSYSKLSHDRRLLVPTASALGLHPAPLRIQSDSSNLPHRTSNPCLCHTSAKSARNPFPCHTYNFARLQVLSLPHIQKTGGVSPFGSAAVLPPLSRSPIPNYQSAFPTHRATSLLPCFIASSLQELYKMKSAKQSCSRLARTCPRRLPHAGPRTRPEEETQPDEQAVPAN